MSVNGSMKRPVGVKNSLRSVLTFWNHFDLGWLASDHFWHALESVDFPRHTSAFSPVCRLRVIEL